MTAWASTTFPDFVILLLSLVALVALRIMFQRVSGLCRINPLRLTMRPHRTVILLLPIPRFMQRPSPNLVMRPTWQCWYSPLSPFIWRPVPDVLL